ncbi:MAG TPA: tetratricopeptide repeat protein [Gemmataceae bacterium]|nr:tetratricopeptide repeat protein [Gemmataceae bacterium]
MTGILRGVVPLVALVGCLGALTVGAADTEEATLKKLKELNKVTGNEALQGALKVLLDDKVSAKQLVAAALPLAREKKNALSYNAALVLAAVSADMKDLANSEIFYRICMAQAAKLQSTLKIAESYVGLIELYDENKKYDESARICQELLELKTDDGKPRIVLTAYITKFGDVDFKEDEAFDTASRLRPGVHRLLIQAVAKQGKYDKALELIDNLLKARDHWGERQLKGWVLRQAGKYEEAAKVYEDVIDRISKDKELEPEKKELDVERCRYILSNVFLDMGKIDLASEQLQQLLAKKPDHPGYNNDLGYIWADNGIKLDEAEKMIRKALELDSKRRQANPKLLPKDNHDNGAYLDSLGWVLFKRGRFEEAKKILLEAVKDKASQHIEIFDHLGDVHLKLGEKAEAVAAWRKGLDFVGEDRRELERKAIVEKKIEQNK